MWFLIVFLLGISPRLILFLIFLFSDYLGRAFDGVFWPLMGFIFMPWTTLWCAYAKNNGGYNLWRSIVLIICIIADLSVDSSSGSKN